VLRALILAALALGPTTQQLGRSYEGRPIEAIHVAGEGQRILVVGCIHGDECEGMKVTRLLGRSAPTADLWLVHQLNPDGYAHRTRGNAHGVDLNRDFLAATQRETRIARKLILRLQPDVTIWFHQPQALVRAWGASRAIAAGMRGWRACPTARSRGRRGARRAGRTGSGSGPSSSSCRPVSSRRPQRRATPGRCCDSASRFEACSGTSPGSRRSSTSCSRRARCCSASTSSTGRRPERRSCGSCVTGSPSSSAPGSASSASRATRTGRTARGSSRSPSTCRCSPTGTARSRSDSGPPGRGGG
jgi:hypothetical protein